MSAILCQMKEDRMAARRAKDKIKTNVLTVFIGDMQTMEKRGTVMDDVLVIQQLKKAVANADENLKIRHSDQDESTANILSSYLPSQMSEDELRVIIQRNVAEGANMGQIMAHLKTNYGGQYDGKLASSIAKSCMA